MCIIVLMLTVYGWCPLKLKTKCMSLRKIFLEKWNSFKAILNYIVLNIVYSEYALF